MSTSRRWFGQDLANKFKHLATEEGNAFKASLMKREGKEQWNNRRDDHLVHVRFTDSSPPRQQISKLLIRLNLMTIRTNRIVMARSAAPVTDSQYKANMQHQLAMLC